MLSRHGHSVKTTPRCVGVLLLCAAFHAVTRALCIGALTRDMMRRQVRAIRVDELSVLEFQLQLPVLQGSDVPRCQCGGSAGSDPGAPFRSADLPWWALRVSEPAPAQPSPEPEHLAWSPSSLPEHRAGSGGSLAASNPLCPDAHPVAPVRVGDPGGQPEPDAEPASASVDEDGVKLEQVSILKLEPEPAQPKLPATPVLARRSSSHSTSAAALAGNILASNGPDPVPASPGPGSARLEVAEAGARECEGEGEGEGGGQGRRVGSVTALELQKISEECFIHQLYLRAGFPPTPPKQTLASSRSRIKLVPTARSLRPSRSFTTTAAATYFTMPLASDDKTRTHLAFRQLCSTASSKRPCA